MGRSRFLFRPRRYLLGVFLAATMGSSPAGAAPIYVCTDASGQRTVSDQPCARAKRTPYDCGRVDGIRTFAEQCAAEAPASGQALPAPTRSARGGASTSGHSLSVTDTRSFGPSATGRGPIDTLMNDVVAGPIVRALVPWAAGMVAAIALIFVLILIARALRPRILGYIGERRVRRVLATLNPAHYQVLHDLTLPDRLGSTQIDHIVIAADAIYVIETKCLSGWLFGTAKQEHWTRVRYRSRQQLQNPLRQNYRHLCAVRAVLDLPEAAVRSYVVLAGSAELRSGSVPGVLSLGALRTAFRAQNERWSRTQRLTLAQRLEAAALPRGWRTHRAHVAGLRAQHASTAARQSPS